MYDYNNLQDAGKDRVEELIREANQERRGKKRKPSTPLSNLLNRGK